MNNSIPNIAKPNEPQENHYRFSVVMKNFARISLISYLIYSIIFLFLSFPKMAIISGICAIIWIGIMLFNQKGRYQFCFLLGIAISVIFSCLAIFLLGWNSGFFYTTILILPLIFLNSKIKSAYRFTFAVLIAIFLVFLYVFSWIYSPVWVLDGSTLRIIYLVNFILMMIVISIIGHFYQTSAEDAERALIQANKKLTGLATTDPVTNLVNRRIMMQRIERERERMERGGKPFVLIMIDIDNFKQVNDEYGHDGGDFVLINMSEIINITLRKQDVVSRWGGDEFLILLPETDLEGGRVVAEKIRSRIIRSPFVYRELDIPITVTFGVGLCDSSIGIGSCIRKADQALYTGKQAGKNRVVTIR